MKCIKCGNGISPQRLKILPNTKECVGCSTTEAVGCVDMVYHKTGNTIQILPKAEADKINKMAKRTGFGAMASLKGGSGREEKIKLTGKTAVIRKSTDADFEIAGKQMMYWLDLGYPEKARRVIESSFDSRLINGTQKNKLYQILEHITIN